MNMSTSLRSVYVYTPNSLHEANDISLVRKRETPSGVKRTSSLNAAEYPSLFNQVTDDDEQTSSLYELEFEAKRQADLKVIERWNRNYANVVATPKVDPRVLVFKPSAVEKVIEVEVDKVNENEPAVQEFNLAKHVNRWVTVVPSRAQRAAMKRSVTESVAREKSSVKSTAISSTPVSHDRADGYAKRVKARVPEHKVEKKARYGKPSGQAKVKNNLRKKVVSPPAKLGFAPMRCSLRPVDTKEWKKIPFSKRNVSKCKVLEREPVVVMMNKFANLKESGLEHNVPTNNPCPGRSKLPRDVVIPQKPQVPKSRRGSSKKTGKVFGEENEKRACPAELLMVNEGADANVDDSSNVLETEPSEMFLYLLRNLTRTSSSVSRVLPVCGHERDRNRFHKCCLIGPSNDYDCLYVPFGGNSDVESLAVCDRTVSKNDESIASRVIICMTNCEKGDSIVDSTEACLRNMLNRHGWYNYEVHGRIFKCLDREMCLLDCVRWFIENGHDSPVQFNRSSLRSHLETARRLPKRPISGNQVCAVTWKTECAANESYQYGVPDAKLYGGSTAESSPAIDSFLHKLLSVCSGHASVTRVLSQRAFSTISRQECCVLRDDNDFNFLIIPVLDEQSAPRAMLVCDRRCTPVKALNFLPVVPGGRKRWGKADDRALKQLLEMHGFCDIRIKFVCRKECDKVELYLLTALKFMLNGSYDDTDLASVAVDSSIWVSSPKDLPQQLKCSLSSDGCHCNDKANTVILEKTPSEEISAKPKATPLKRRSGVMQSSPRSVTPCRERSVTPRATPLKRKSEVACVSPSTVSPSPMKTRRVYRDKLTKGIELTKRAVNKAKMPREKKLVIGSLSTLNEGTWVEGEVLNAFLRLVQELRDSHYRILDPNLDEFESNEIKVPGFPLKGLALYPINVGRNHWCLGVINFDTKKVIVYDSIKSVKTPSTDCMARIQKVWSLCTDSKLFNQNVSCSEQVCEQTDSFNCGLFTCYHGLCLITERPINIGFTSAVAQCFRRTVTEFLRSNVMIRDEEGSIFENAVYTFPTDSLVMLKVSPQLELRVETQPLPLPVFPNSGSAERRTTPRVKSVERSAAKSRVSLGRRKASDVGSDTIVASANDVLKTPLKPNTDIVTPASSKVAPICATPNTIDKMSVQLESTCILKDGESPLKQPRLTRSSSIRKASTRKLFSENKVAQNNELETEKDKVLPVPLTPTTIDKMTAQLKNISLPHHSDLQLTHSVAQTSNVDNDDVSPANHGCDTGLDNVNARFDPLPMMRSTTKVTASRAALDHFKGTSLKQIVRVLCSNASTKVVVLSQYALKYGGISRSCCYVSRNPHDVLVMLYEERRHPVALLVCDRRRSTHTVTLFAPSTSSVRVANTFADTILPIHEWYDYSGKVIRRDNVIDLKAYFASTLHSVLIDESYDESDLGTSRVAKFLLDHPGSGTSLVNGGCGFFDGPCPCAIPRAIDHVPTRPLNYVVPIMHDIAVADPQPATQTVSDRTVWTKKTHFFNVLGEKKEICLDSLKSLRRDGTELERYLQDDVVYAYCSVVSVSQFGINSVVDPQLLENDQNYVSPNYPIVNGTRYFPICNAQHWVLAVFDFEKRSVTVLDSQQHQKGSMTVRGDVQRIVILAWRRFTDLPLPCINSAPLSEIAKQSVQDNYNCGVYVCYHVMRALMRWTENPAEFTEQSANEYREEIARALRDNFYVVDENFNGLIPSHVEQLVQAPLPLQTLVVASQNTVRPQYHSGQAALANVVGSQLARDGNAKTKNKFGKIGAPLVTDYYLSDDYMTSSSEKEQDDVMTHSSQQLNNVGGKDDLTNKSFLHFLPRVCASSTRKVALMSHHLFLNSKVIQKCCVFDREKNAYEVLVLPIVLSGALCGIVIGEKTTSSRNTGKKARRDIMTLIVIDDDNAVFSGNKEETNTIVSVFAAHGLKNPAMSRIKCTAGTVSSSAQLIVQTRCKITGDTSIQATTDDMIRTVLEGIPQYTEVLQGSLMNGLCQTVTGTCGCPFSDEVSLICSFLTDLKRRSTTKMTVLSPYLTTTSETGIYNCCVWNKQLNDYKMVFMPIEFENSLGILQYCRQMTASCNRVRAVIYVGLRKKETEPSVSQSLRKRIREILRIHHLPATSLSVEATKTCDVVGFLCHKASLAVSATTDSLETFLRDWPKKAAAIKSVRGCAHMRECPCKLYGDCKARTNCAIYKDTDLLPNGSSIGDMDKRCPYCDAHLFRSESYAICCQNGKVRVTEEELSQTIPAVMREFKKAVMEDTSIFDRTMLINNNISLASNLFNQRALKTAGERTLVIEGQYNAGICHVEGRDPKQPAFAQLYFTADENLNTHFVKFKWYTKKIQDYVRKLMTVLKACNVLIQNYVTCGELLKAEKDRRKHEGLVGEPRLLMNIKNKREDIPHGVLSSTVHKGRINKPAVDNQVACIWVGDVPKQDELVDGLRVRERGGATLAPHFVPALDALLFVLLFPLGELGYVHDVNKYKRPGGPVRKHAKCTADPADEDAARIEDNLNGCDELAIERKEEQAKYVSRREWTLYMLAQRGLAEDLKWHRILGWGKVTAQWILFQWSRIEADRIAHITKNCTELRGVQQSALFDYLDNQLQTKQNVKLGSLTSMPASYTGGPGWLQTNYQDSMMVALEEGRPTFLITLTGNKDWEELLKHRIHKNDRWYTDPMLCARVFHEKLKMLLDDIRLGKIFGEVVALQYSIEYQKRGMPHAHILVTLKRKLTTPQSVDEVVCAELPILPDINDPTYDSVKQLRDKVLKHMIHRPCEGKDKLACRQGRSNCLRCNKCYPFPYCNDTYVSKNGHHVYRRRNNCAPFLVGGEGSRKVFATNAYIVPYNKWLLSKYDCHINVEVVCSATACKYIYKYIYKGPDHLVLELLEDSSESAVERQKRMVKDQNNQEVLELNMAKEHVNARYLSQVEAAYRILGYALAGSMHTVIRLYSHLPDNKYVWFVNGREPGEAKKSELEAYFELIAAAQADNSPAKDLLWKNVAEQYVFDEKRRVYVPRKRKRINLAYIRFVPPKFVNQYALRLLLTQRPAGSFEELRTVNGVLHATFADAAVAAGYIRADEEWDRCLALVSHNAMPRELRRVFASLLVYCKVVNGKELWEKYKEQMRDRRPNCTDDTLDQFSLSHIEWILTMQGSSLDTCNMSGLLVANQRNAAARYDPDDDIVAAPVPTGGAVPQLNAKQQGVMDTILTAIQQPVGTKRLFFLYGKAGCGKTFTYNRLIAECRTLGKRVIAVASTGIAATLLDGGRTAHSTFKIPINLDKDSVIRLDAQGQIAERLRRADLIVWDEAPMQSRFAMEAVDRMMRDIAETHRRQLPFGGATVVFGGDWSQFLPVVRTDGGTDLEAETIAVILKSSYLWPHVQVLTLDQNMRVVAGEEAHMKWLRMVGEGECQHKGGPDINLPLEMYAETEKEIVDWMYTPDVLQSPERMGRVALLSVRNDDTLDLNEQILELLPGQEYILSSADQAADNDQQLYGVTESIEFIHSLTPSGMPPHLLKLKVGCIVMLLRNIDISNNLCNGTRLEVLGVVQDRNVSLLRCRHLNGNARNECFIQRMPLNHEDTFTGLAFERVQFPVRLAFAMTTNKSQGQTFDKVGLVLRTPAFAHGSTYVALSRCTSKTGIKVTMNRKPKKDNAVPYVGVRNIVYKSVI